MYFKIKMKKYYFSQEIILDNIFHRNGAMTIKGRYFI